MDDILNSIKCRAEINAAGLLTMGDVPVKYQGREVGRVLTSALEGGTFKLTLEIDDKEAKTLVAAGVLKDLQFITDDLFIELEAN